MKKIVILFLCFFTIINFSSAQTEKETIDYLNAKFTAYGPIIMGHRLSYFISTPLDSISNKKVIQIDFVYSGEVGGYTKFFSENVTSIENSRAPNGNLNLIIISPKKLIASFVDGDDVEIFEREFKLVFSTTDEEVLKIKKALEHLLKLNGASLIDDNLFKD